MAQQEVDTFVSLKKNLVGEMCYLMVNLWRLRFGTLSLRFWLKTKSFAMLTRVF